MTRYFEDHVPTFADRAHWTLPTVLRHRAAERPHAVYLDAPEEDATWTYRELLEAAEQVASGLYTAGARQGDRVLIMAANSSQFVRTWCATAVGGLVEVPLNTAYERDFLGHQVATVEARWAVIDDVHADRFVQIEDRCGHIERFWVIDTGVRETALETLRSRGWTAGPWEALEQAPSAALPVVSPQDLAAIFFTSGTTGPSKGVAMPHAQMYFFGDETATLTRLTGDDTYLTATPLFHGNAQFMAAYPAMIKGARLVLRTKFSATRWVDWLREGGVTVTNLLGVMMDFVWKQPARPDDADNSLRCVFSAPTASSILGSFKERFGIEAFVEVFGLTETSAPIASPYGEDRPAGAAGLQIRDWFDIRLVNPDTDEEVEVGQVGELVVRGRYPFVTSLGYYNMPDRTVEAWRNLWFHTGDALRCDEEGWYYFVDRYKDALRRRGENISSYEIEQAILGSDSVLECAVIGVPAGIEAGEDEVMACIVPADSGASAEEIWEWCDGRLPSFALPRFIRFVDSLPRTQSEKVQKAELRAVGVTSDTFDRTLARTP